MASSCPFLKNLHKINYRNLSLDNLYVQSFRCPYLSRACANFADTDQNEIMTEAVKEIDSKCPFNQKSEPVISTVSNPTTRNNEDHFNYQDFFDEKIEDKMRTGSYRIFKRINRSADNFPYARSHETNISIDKLSSSSNKNVLVWCSNDYLGLSRHPKVIESARKTVESSGVGSGGTRNISGNQILHEKLESSLANWYKKEAGLIFTSCYVANSTTLYTLAKMLPNMVFISDAGNHASMIEGIRNSRVPKYIYRHNDVNHLEEILRSLDPNIPKIVAFESLNSMNGSIAQLKNLCDVSHKYGALTFVDEVHAVGLYGYYGSGQGEQQNCLEFMDIISGTLGKAVGSMGGFIVGKRNLIDTVRSYGSGLIFTTSLPPVLVSSALKSIEILNSDEGRLLRSVHQNVSKNLRTELTRNGFPIFHSISHILPVHVGDANVCRNICDYLLEKNKMYVQAINYPTVKVGTERLRIAPTPHHNPYHVEMLMDSLIKAWNYYEQPVLHQKCLMTECNCISRCQTYQKPAISAYAI